MQIEGGQGTIVRSGDFKESNFKIKASAKAFKILSSGLYSNKIKAIIRELSTNAYDSHVEAGCKDKPFLVHLPNSFEPYFSIRDFGTGLSEDSLYEIFTTYFDSDKTNSNDAVGCLGLGSKSPFSYTDSYTVVSYYNGVKVTCNMFLDEEGIPSIAKLTEEDTDEPNGLEILLDVELIDIGRFQSEAQSVYKHFPVKPEGVICEDQEYIYKTDQFGLRSFGDSNKNAIMGNIAYPINMYSLNYSVQNDFVRLGIDLFFDIGELNFVASREALEYDKAGKTAKALEDKFEQIKDDLKHYAETLFENCECYFDACVKYQEVKSYFDFSNPTFQGVELKSYIEIEDDIFTSDFHVYDTIGRRGGIEKRKVRRINFSSKDEFYLVDQPRGSITTARRLTKQNGCRVYLIPNEPENIKKFCEIIGIPQDRFRKISEYYIKPDYNRSSDGRRYAKVFSLKSGFDNPGSFWDEDIDIDLEDVGYYVPIKRYKVINGNKEMEPGCLLSLINLYEKLSGVKIDVIGIKTTMEERFKKNGWINLFDGIRTLINSIETDEVLEAYTYHIMEHKGLWWWNELANTLKKFDKTTFFGKSIEILRAIQEKRSKLYQIGKDYLELCNNFSVEPKTCPIVDLTQLLDLLDYTYPMLKCIDQFEVGRNISIRNIVNEYINQRS